MERLKREEEDGGKDAEGTGGDTGGVAEERQEQGRFGCYWKHHLQMFPGDWRRSLRTVTLIKDQRVCAHITFAYQKSGSQRHLISFSTTYL